MMQGAAVAIVGCCRIAATGSTGEMNEARVEIDAVLTRLRGAAA